MKTQYSRRPKLLSSGGTIFSLGLIALFALVLIVRFAFPDVFLMLARPAFMFGSAATDAAALPESATALALERDALKAQNDALTNENRALAAKLADQTALEDVSARITAGVLAGPPLAPYDVLIVGAGTGDGVREGALAYAAGGVPIGTVSEVSAATARIVLFSQAGRATGGWVGEHRLPLTLAGTGAGAFDANIPAEAEVALGDTLYLPGPGPLAAGTVARIDRNASDPRATLFIRPFVNVFTITTVSIARSAP